MDVTATRIATGRGGRGGDGGRFGTGGQGGAGEIGGNGNSRVGDGGTGSDGGDGGDGGCGAGGNGGPSFGIALFGQAQFSGAPAGFAISAGGAAGASCAPGSAGDSGESGEILRFEGAQEQPPQPEVVLEACNGEDDDQDGRIDEAILRLPGDGPGPLTEWCFVPGAGRGQRICIDGAWGPCALAGPGRCIDGQRQGLQCVGGCWQAELCQNGAWVDCQLSDPCDPDDAFPEVPEPGQQLCAASCLEGF